MQFLLTTKLKDLGFSKKAQYDPTAEHQRPDNHSLYKKINNVPTTQSIELLGKEWLYRKPIGGKKLVTDPKEINE